MNWLTARDVELLHMLIIDKSGGSYGVRAKDRLEASVAVQRQTVFGEAAYTTIFDKAAALARGIIMGHPFVDGNKRTGIMAALLLLNLNGQDTINLSDEQVEDFAVRVATEKLDVPAIAAWLQANCS